MAQDNQSFNLIGKEFLNVAPFCLFLSIPDKDEEFITKAFICGKNLVQHLGIIVDKQVRDNDADKFCISVGENPRHLIFFIIKINKCFCDNFLVFKCQ